MVYPYGDGDYQYRVMADDELVSEFLNDDDYNLSILEKKSTKYDAKYGFCQFFNREVYIEGGLENENFVKIYSQRMLKDFTDSLHWVIVLGG